MYCAQCPYALLCLGDHVQRGFCIDCGCTLLELTPGYEYQYMKGEYVDHDWAPGHWVLLRCHDISRTGHLVHFMSCPRCKPLLPMWRGEVVEDQRDL